MCKKKIPEMKKDCAEKMNNKKSKRFEIYDKKFCMIFFYENTLIFLRKTFLENSGFILSNNKSRSSLRICFT